MGLTGGTAVFQRRIVVAIAGVILAALLAILAVALTRGRTEVPGISGQAPAIAARTFNGAAFSLDDRKGPVFIYFWASWCVPCETEAPVIQRLWEERYRDRGYTFIGVNMWDADADARAFADRYRLTFPLIRDEGGKVYLAYGVERLPMAFFVRPGLEIDRRYLGVLDEADLREMLDRLEPRS